MTRIGIDVNGVLRDIVSKFDQLYEKYLIEKEKDFFHPTYRLDMSGNTEQISIEEENFDYQKISEVSSLELDKHYSFKNKDEYFSFMYEDYTMELFGHAPSTEMMTFNILNELYLEHRENYHFSIVSSEIGKSKPSTLFFLSKFGCLLEKVVFFSEVTKKNMWDEIDVLLTSNPELLLNKPTDKTVIKYNTSYNKHIDSDLEISSLSEFIKTLKKIKYAV